MKAVLSKLRWSLRRRGFAGTIRAAAKNLGRKLQPESERPPHPFDLEHGTDTDGFISGVDLASGHPNDRFIEGYAAVPPSRFHSILARWQASGPPHMLAQYTFVDLGCGKGRAVLLAAQAGFRAVVGVELNPSLAATAQANANLWNAAGKARCPIRVEPGDAAEFVWPAGPCVVFLFNPFSGVVMQRVLDRTALAFHDRPSDLEVLYYKAEEPAAFTKSYEMIWCEATGISPQDLAADLVASPTDETQAYRLLRTHRAAGQGMSSQLESKSPSPTKTTAPLYKTPLYWSA